MAQTDFTPGPASHLQRDNAELIARMAEAMIDDACFQLADGKGEIDTSGGPAFVSLGGNRSFELDFERLARAAIESLSPQPPAETGDDDAELRIVFDRPPSHESGRFVECETADGRSVNAGQWHERPDGLWELRIASRLSISTGDDELVSRLRADIAELNANPAETTGAPHSFYEAANRLEALSRKGRE